MEFIGKQYKISLDMHEELNKLAYQCLVNFQKEHGHLKNVKKEDALYQWFLLQSKLLPPKSRSIEKAKDFCCPSEAKSQLQSFEEAVQAGQDLVEYMSRDVLNAAFEDKMFSDWRFYHFHLSDPNKRHLKDKRFLKRGDYLLIAYMESSDDDTMYFLQIIPHKRANWTKEELVRVLADNWPELIKRNVFEGSLTASINDRDRKQLRENNINAPVDLGDGRVIIGLGSGICGDGSSFAIRHKCVRFGNEAQIFAMRIETDVDTIGELIHEKLQNEQKAFNLELMDLPNTQTAVFRVSDTPVFLGVTLKKYVVAGSREQVLCTLNR
ncbi:hypothetical protein [Paenibacillus sp.]